VQNAPAKIILYFSWFDILFLSVSLLNPPLSVFASRFEAPKGARGIFYRSGLRRGSDIGEHRILRHAIQELLKGERQNEQ
jgi:hypothetical protein